MEPPIDARSISEKDSDNEDQPSSFNHLSRKLLNAPAELVLHQPTGISLSGENDKIDSEIPKPPSKQKQKNKKKQKRKGTYNDLINAPPKSAESPKYKKTMVAAKCF